MRLAARPFLVVLKKRVSIIFSEKNLLYTNIGIGTGISILGDTVTQTYQRSQHTSSRGLPWNIQRTLQMAGAGFVSGPIFHYWYHFLDKFLPGRNLRTVAIKVFLDQLLGSPIWIMIFLYTTGTLRGQKEGEFKQDVKEKGLKLFSVDFLVWPPAQFFNFLFLPPQFRVLYDNVLSLIVDALYSYVHFDHDNCNSNGMDNDTGTEIRQGSSSVELSSASLSSEKNLNSFKCMDSLQLSLK